VAVVLSTTNNTNKVATQTLPNIIMLGLVLREVAQGTSHEAEGGGDMDGREKEE
jgi:hypothetical protein